MVYINTIENHTHKMFIILHNTPSFNEISKLCNEYQMNNGNKISFSRNFFSIVKELLLEIQRITVDLYNNSDKFLNIISTDKEVIVKDFNWNVNNFKYNNYTNIIENIRLMETIDDKSVIDLLHRNIEKAITVLGKPTSEQIKFVELFYKNNSDLYKKKKSVKWWEWDNDITFFNDNEDTNFSFFNNMGSLVLFVNNFNDELCENIYEMVKNNMIEHKKNIHGVNKLKSLRLIIVNVINEQTTLFEKYCTFDLMSNVYLDRYNIHLNENSKETISCLLREMFNLNSLTITNIPMKKESNKKLNSNVEILYPYTFLPFENLKKFKESSEKTVDLKMVCENNNALENYTTHTVSWNSIQKRLPLVIQTLPFTIADFSSGEGVCVGDFVLNGKVVLPELILKNIPLKDIDLAFTLSKNIDASNEQIGIIDEVLYESKKVNDSEDQKSGDEKIMKRMSAFINECTSDIVMTNDNGLIIDDKLRKAYYINPLNKLPCSNESEECFRGELNKITKILQRSDSINHTYLYLKAIIESKKRSKDEMKCILDVISNFRYVSNSHEELYEDFCYFYFSDHYHIDTSTKLKLFKNKVKIKPTNKNVSEKFIKEYEDKKPEFAGWINKDKNEKAITPLYKNIKNKSNNESQNRIPFKSTYVVPDSDEMLLSEYAKYTQPLSDDYLKVAPPPYIYGWMINEDYDRQTMEYRNYVNLITNTSLSRDARNEIERKCEKFRLTYNKISPPSETTHIQSINLRKRMNANNINHCNKKISKIVNVNLNESVKLTKNELDMIDKMNENYRKSIKGKIISVDEFVKKMKDLQRPSK